MVMVATHIIMLQVAEVRLQELTPAMILTIMAMEEATEMATTATMQTAEIPET